jgi:hypothetical protein
MSRLVFSGVSTVVLYGYAFEAANWSIEFGLQIMNGAITHRLARIH